MKGDAWKKNRKSLKTEYQKKSSNVNWLLLFVRVLLRTLVVIQSETVTEYKLD